MKKKKNTTQESLITVVIMAASIIAFIGGYVLSSGLTTRDFYSINYVNNDEVVSADTGLTGDLAFDENNLYDRDINYKYNISFPTLNVNENTELKTEYGNNGYEVVVRKYVDGVLSKEYKLEFDNQVNDILAHKGVDESKDVIYYLLANGTVEYTLVEDLMTNDYLRTNGRLTEAENIVRFVNGTACNKDTGICDEVIFAQTNDGLLYNIDEMI